jgi:hypothetical protein
MQQKQHHSHDERDMNQTAANVKREEPQQPKNNQNQRSVEELAEEGQDFEAEVVSGVENAPDADKGEVRTKEVPEDDVPPEYLDKG